MGGESLNLSVHYPNLAYQIYRPDAQLLAGKPGARTSSVEEIHSKYTERAGEQICLACISRDAG